MHFPFFSLRRTGLQIRAAARAKRNSARVPTSAKRELEPAIERGRNQSAPTAIWTINTKTGRLECRWTSDRDAIDRWRSLALFERFAIVLAVTRQSRNSIRPN